MNTTLKIRSIPAIAAFAIAAAPLVVPSSAFGADEAAARALARQNNCFKCHQVDKAKAGPSWKEIATKLKGKPNAEAEVIKHLTTGPKVKTTDGSEEEHPIIKSKSEADTKNLVDWILSL